MRKTWLLALAGLAVTAACQKDDPLSPQSSARFQSAQVNEGARTVSVMSRNIYVGFNGDAVIAALARGNPDSIAAALQMAIGQLQRTNFAVRAAVFADEVAKQRPHVVGVQEAYKIYADLNALGVPVVIDEDHLAMLRAAFAARNLPYALVDSVMDVDMQPFPGISIVDREAMFVDTSRVTITGPVIAKQFDYNIGVIAPGIDKKTGYIAAPVSIGGVNLTFVTTHLESDLGPGTYELVAPLRAAQAMEIAAVLGTGPAIVVGDLNDHAGSGMYQVFQGAGFQDVWPTLHPDLVGNTDTCVPQDLSGNAANCQDRIDFIFARGLVQPDAGLLGSMKLVGITPNERTAVPDGYLWPSDHAGLVGNILLPPALGLAAAN